MRKRSSTLTSFAIAKFLPLCRNCRAPSYWATRLRASRLWSLPMLPGHQLAAARRCQYLAVFVDHLSPTDRDDGPAGEFPARKDGEFGVRQLILIANRSLQVGIPDHHVGIGPHRDRSLARIEAKKLGRICRRQRHHLLERDAYRAHAFGVQQWQLDLKIVPRRSMVDDIERRIELVLTCIPHMIRIDHVDRPSGSGTPQVVRITLLSQRRVASENRAVGLVEPFLGQVQVQKSHFGEDWQTTRPRRLGYPHRSL